jgi:hypothetical protein
VGYHSKRGLRHPHLAAGLRFLLAAGCTGPTGADGLDAGTAVDVADVATGADEVAVLCTTL